MSTKLIDPIAIAQELIRCPSITPAEAGALSCLAQILEQAGFETHRLSFSEPHTYPVDNLYARFGHGKPHFCFAGHTDVVPVGDPAGWTHPPFGADIADGRLFGRGAEDMKGAIAAFSAAAIRFIEDYPHFGGSISLLITGDEEADAVNGTVKLIDWAMQRGEAIDACIVGEPTNAEQLGTIIKNGRRGSLSASLVVEGKQGHVAYPERSINPITIALPLLNSLIHQPFDQGNNSFPASNLEITSIDVGNPASNVVPARLTARFNIRFNNQWNEESLKAEIERRLKMAAPSEARYRLDIVKPVSEAFLTNAPALVDPLQAAIYHVTGGKAAFSTAGGTSDARFIKNYCPVVEFGLVFDTLHQVDESISIKDLQILEKIYHRFLCCYFGVE